MSSALLHGWSQVAKPLVGMLHLPALPGSPRHALPMDQIERAVLRDADALLEGGIHGLLIENFSDVPFYPDRVPAHTISHMTALACAVKRRFNAPLGINVLRNDGLSALAVAHAAGAQFIRVNVLCGARVADQGILQGIAHDLLRYRAQLRADVKIFADVNVKHSAPLGPYSPQAEVQDTIERGLADALIVSGVGTGKAVDLDELKGVKAAAGRTPVFLGSGVGAQNVKAYLPHADGFIVGTSLKVDGVSTHPVDVHRVKELVQALCG